MLTFEIHRSKGFECPNPLYTESVSTHCVLNNVEVKVLLKSNYVPCCASRNIPLFRYFVKEVLCNAWY